MRLTLGKIGWGAVGALFLMTPLFASTSKAEIKTDQTPTHNWAYAEEASGLLQEIRSLSARAAESTARLDSASRGNQLHWRSHSEHLTEIKSHVNAMGEKFNRLQEIHGMIAPWQQKAVERVLPNAVALADHTQGALVYLNENQNRLWASPYKDRLSAMSDHVQEMHSTLKSFLDYGKTSDRLKALELEIEYAGA
jgi:hypothetical protein